MGERGGEADDERGTLPTSRRHQLREDVRVAHERDRGRGLVRPLL